MKMWSAIGLSAISGLLLTAGFPKLELFFLSWVALIPLLAALRGRSWKEALLLGYLCGLVHYATTLYWIKYVVDRYGGLPLPVALGVLLLLCAYLAVYPACFAIIAHKWESYPRLWILGLPSVWVALEWARAHALTGFPWANLGYTQTPLPALIQVADLAGVYGVSWLVVLGNTAIMACLNRVRVGLSLGVLAVCMVSAASYGAWRLDSIREIQGSVRPWTVGVVQGNIDQSHKWDPAFQQETLRRYRELSLKAVTHGPPPDLLVWPETAAPFFYETEESLTGQLNEIFKEVGVPVLFGSPGETVMDGQARLQNRAYLVNGRGLILGKYAKQHLVPFGEYVPMQKLLFFVHRLVEAAGDFVPGHDPAPLYLREQAFGVLICYEDIFPYLARRTVQKGATSLVNITNDAWYGDTSAPYQHLEIARWRAIEFRRPLIRAANTGISAVFDATGSACGKLLLNDQGQLVCKVYPLEIQTVYSRWGNFFAWLCVFTALGGLVWSSRQVGPLS